MYLLACLRHSASCRYGTCKEIRFKSSLVGFVRAARGAAIQELRHHKLDMQSSLTLGYKSVSNLFVQYNFLTLASLF